ncbi:hypothetical protein [Microbacterium sp.]|uniref:hypothetical protein n=1 Tax=Microbacterium sp. TaxID=51671 RepID=UPI003F9AAAD7
MRRALSTISAATVALLLLSGCAAGEQPTHDSASPEPVAVAPTEPTIEITYEIDGRSETVRAHPDKQGCSARMLQAFSDSDVASSVSLPAGGDSGQIRAFVLDDLYVGFLGSGDAQITSADDGSSSASVVSLEGTATLVEIPEGESPSAGELDLSTGTEVPATLTATVVCRTE